MSTKKLEREVSVALNFRMIELPIIGTTPLIVNRFSEKCKTQIKESAKLKQGGKKKNIIDPEEQYQNSIYYLSDGKSYGFPAGAIKASIVRAAFLGFGRPMTSTRTLINVIADDNETGLVEIHGEPRMREDMVRVGGASKTASPRYRAEFPMWSAVLKIEYFEDAIIEEDLVKYVASAGKMCGIGEWRPERSNSGRYGCFEIAQ